VADVVPLDANNRILVQQGLQRIRAGRCRPGIRALLEIAGRQAERAVSADLGFAVGPRINAAGRLDDMAFGIRCLLEDDLAQARLMAAELDNFNRERRAIESGMQQEALRLVDTATLAVDSLPWGLCLYRDDWHQGVVGLVASRIKERTNRPVIAFAPGADGELKGSARSIKGLHLRDAIADIAAARPGLIERFGGHAMAAGLTLREANFDDFAREFDALVRQRLTAQDLASVLDSDGELDGPAFSLQTAERLRDAGPWGQHFPEPLFDGAFWLRGSRIVGERHLRMDLEPCSAPGMRLEAIAFNVDPVRRPQPGSNPLRVAYRLDVNEYRGVRRLQLLVEEFHAEDGAAAGEVA
jgi:single-stranded-DNA-specific exonuclease